MDGDDNHKKYNFDFGDTTTQVKMRNGSETVKKMTEESRWLSDISNLNLILMSCNSHQEVGFQCLTIYSVSAKAI